MALHGSDRAAGAHAPLALHPHSRDPRRVLDRRGHLGRDRPRALDVDPARAPAGRLAARVLPAARSLDPALRRQRGPDARAVARLRDREHPARLLRRARPVRPHDRPRLRAACGARPVPHVLRAGDAHVRARGVPLGRRHLVVRGGDHPREASVARRLHPVGRAPRLLAQLGPLRLRRPGGRDRARRS